MAIGFHGARGCLRVSDFILDGPDTVLRPRLCTSSPRAGPTLLNTGRRATLPLDLKRAEPVAGPRSQEPAPGILDAAPFEFAAVHAERAREHRIAAAVAVPASLNDEVIHHELFEANTDG